MGQLFSIAVLLLGFVVGTAIGAYLLAAIVGLFIVIVSALAFFHLLYGQNASKCFIGGVTKGILQVSFAGGILIAILEKLKLQLISKKTNSF